jgi:hypothetical protein
MVTLRSFVGLRTSSRRFVMLSSPEPSEGRIEAQNGATQGDKLYLILCL